MSTLEDRMNEFMEDTKWDAPKVARVAGVTTSAVYQWLGHGNKPINSIGKIEAAIYLERESGYSALWLAKGLGPKRVTKVQTTGEPASPYNVTPWPFSRIDKARYDRLTPEDKRYVQGRLLQAIEECESTTT